MISLAKLIKETEGLGIIVLYADIPISKGRHLIVDDLNVIFIDRNLNEIEAINVLLHERCHFINDDYNSALASVESFLNRLEVISEEERIIDFFNLITQEYPIDETFNIESYLKNAYIEPRFENLVRKLATEMYEQSKKKTTPKIFM